ncbi:MAG: rod shape-determining protein [Acidaminococcaceae bacterium]|nr:rod shape-determining protein [Acidaminococcaceae bacterium]HBX75987.1 rod shape-determining protein [Acidaminococcaceae bacterium]
MFGGHTDIGIDLGTANILVYVKGKGIVLNEPSVVAVEKAGNKILAVGAEARDMLGRTPQGIVAVRPLKEGVIANYTITQKMLEYIVNKVAGKSFFFKPRVMTCIPVHITSVEKRAVLEATIQAGVSKTYLIEEPLAAALGAGLDIMVPSGKMVVDIGGGTTDIGILSLGGVVDSDSVRIGGDKFDESIVRYVKKEYNVLIGDTTGEAIKKTIGNVHPGAEVKSMDVRGRDGINGLPTTVTVTSEDVRKALEEPLETLIGRIRSVLEKCPPELSADIVDNGIYLTGGGALLGGFAKVLEEDTGIRVFVADNPLDCVAIGTGKALDNLDKLRPGTVYSNAMF